MLSLSVLKVSLGVARLDKSDPIPNWATQENEFFSITKTKDELSVVCPEEKIPHGVKSEKDWGVLKVEGPLDFSLTGILSSLLGPLAEAKVSVFAISTFDTDYILIKKKNLPKAVDILRKFCHVR